MRRLYEDFGRRLREARGRAGLTQEALAARVGLSRTSITNIERGNQHIPLHILFRLAGAVGVDAAELLPNERSLAGEGVVPDELLRGWERETSQWMKAIVALAGTEEEAIESAD